MTDERLSYLSALMTVLLCALAAPGMTLAQDAVASSEDARSAAFALTAAVATEDAGPRRVTQADAFQTHFGHSEAAHRLRIRRLRIRLAEFLKRQGYSYAVLDRYKKPESG